MKLKLNDFEIMSELELSDFKIMSELELSDFEVMSELELMEIVKDINDEVHDYYVGYAFYNSLHEFQNEINAGDISDDGVLVRTDTTVGILYEY